MTGELAALATALLWSWNALLFTSAGRKVGSFPVNLIRLLFGSFFLFTTHFFVIGDYSISQRGLSALATSGFVGLVIGDLTLFKSFVILGARRSLLIMALAPAFTTILSFFFLNETPGIREISGIIITITAIYWVMSESGAKQEPVQGSLISGVLLALTGALCQAIGLVFAKYGLNDQQLDPLYATLIRMVTALISVSLLMIISRRSGQVLRAFRSGTPFGLILLGSVFGPFLGVWLSMVAIKFTHTGVGATIMSTSPILIIPFSMIFHKDKPTLRAISGTLLAVAGILVLFWK